jgi:hypothetical protein
MQNAGWAGRQWAPYNIDLLSIRDVSFVYAS